MLVLKSAAAKSRKGKGSKMIEAVNAIVSNAQMIRAVAEQTSSTQSFASNPSRIQTAAVTAPYLSPHVDLNGGSSKPIFVVRDSATGDHIRQFPTEGQIRAYQRAQDAQSRVEVRARSTDQAAVKQQSVDLVESSVQFRQQRQEVQAHQSQNLPGNQSGGNAKKELSIGGSSSGSGSSEPAAGTTSSRTSLDTEA